MDRPDETLMARLEKSLRETRAVRIQLAARLRELEADADSVRAQLAEIDGLLIQTQGSIVRLFNSMMASNSHPSDLELEAVMDYGISHVAEPRRQPVPFVRSNTEPTSDRFIDRTIPQAVTMLLREEGAPLHVNELYNRLLEGGFKFSGQNPTISIAVSLNRNSRFRKVAPGTFDLMIRDASKAS